MTALGGALVLLEDVIEEVFLTGRNLPVLDALPFLQQYAIFFAVEVAVKLVTMLQSEARQRINQAVGVAGNEINRPFANFRSQRFDIIPPGACRPAIIRNRTAEQPHTDF